MYICTKIKTTIAIDILNIDKLKIHFKNQKIFTTKDIADFYSTFKHNVNSSTINWRVYTLVKRGIIKRIGTGVFSFGESKVYVPMISSKMKYFYNIIKKKFPYLNICVWDTSVINEFMLHQPWQFYLIIEVDKEATQSVFFFLKELKQAVFIEPTNDIIEKYFPTDKNAVIIKSLVSEAPLQTIGKLNTISLEKMLVDIFCDDIIFSHQQGAEMRTIFNEAFTKYTVNQNKMLRYANRKRKKDSLKEYLNKNQIYGSKRMIAANL